MQGTAELHREIADALLPQADPVFHHATTEDVSEVLVCYSLGVYETQSNPQATRVIA